VTLFAMGHLLDAGSSAAIPADDVRLLMARSGCQRNSGWNLSDSWKDVDARVKLVEMGKLCGHGWNTDRTRMQFKPRNTRMTRKKGTGEGSCGRNTDRTRMQFRPRNTRTARKKGTGEGSCGRERPVAAAAGSGGSGRGPIGRTLSSLKNPKRCRANAVQNYPVGPTGVGIIRARAAKFRVV
jgi:hypothetical protein